MKFTDHATSVVAGLAEHSPSTSSPISVPSEIVDVSVVSEQNVSAPVIVHVGVKGLTLLSSVKV